MSETHPLRTRYSSPKMQAIWSKEGKFTGWRECWVALAEAEMELGIDRIKPEHISAMKQFLSDVPYARADELERELRHDVMAHIHAYGEQVDGVHPGTSGIIHLGATSAFPCDNTELSQMRDSLDLVIGKTVNVLRRMKSFALENLTVPCLAKTHYQAAQPTTYGKRIVDWMQNIVMSLRRVEYERGELRARGVKGTTGTQDSFLELFDGDEGKVRDLDLLVADKLGFDDVYDVTTQTYPRVVDYHVLSSLVGLAVAARKMGGDLRLLQGEKELSEPYKKSQVGSSAMAYKKNPMRAERMFGLARDAIPAAQKAAHYASDQWLERTLDDSAQRRIVLADTFLEIDAVLNLALDIFTRDTEQQYGFRIYPKRAKRNLMEEMPFIVTERLMMGSVKRGEDRQRVHEIVRLCSLKAREDIEDGRDNTMMTYLRQHDEFGLVGVKDKDILAPEKYVGTAATQARRYIDDVVEHLLDRHSDIPHMDGGVKV